MTGAARPKADTGFLPVLPPRFALFELAVFAAIIACEYGLEAFPDLTRLNPHPYWIAVLLLSLQYGTVSGLLAAALAIGGTLLLGLPEMEIGESYFNYLVRVWTQPVLWIVVALLLGSFRMRQIEERVGLQKQADDAITQSGSLADYARGLRSRVDALERQLAGKSRPDTYRLLEALNTVATAPAGEKRDQAAHAAMTLAVPGAALSVLVLDGDGLRQILAHNWPLASGWRPDLRGDDALTRAVVGERRVVSVLQSADDHLTEREAKIAVPLLAGDGSGVIGMLRVEQIGSVELDEAVLARVAGLARALTPLVSAGPAQAAIAPTSVIAMLRRVRVPLRLAPAEAAPHDSTSPSLGLARPPIETRS